ncbi:hypothetical protein SNEBB_005565 [Seison nebaliae]|nr:hypothetical protein SNEBB_005565 [Seison nebaliae]
MMWNLLIVLIQFLVGICTFLCYIYYRFGVEHLLLHYRWIFVCIFLLPLSFLFDVYTWVRESILLYVYSAPRAHKERVEYVRRQVLDWKTSGSTKKLCTGRAAWLRTSLRNPKYTTYLHNIHVNLMDVIGINEDEMTVQCEPLVTMGRLSNYLKKFSYTIPVVPELDDLTVGGLINGVGIESSSHIFGLFHNIVKELEIVMANGDVVTCSEEENVELFHAIPWSHGTLGFVTLATLRICRCPQFIRLKYSHAKSFDEVQERMEKLSNDESNQFVECLVYSPTHSVVMTGQFCEEVEADKINSIGSWYKPWFYIHVQETRDNTVEYIPIREYYHRHTRAIFWQLSDIIPFGNNLIFRLLFGWMMPPKVSLLKLTQGETIKALYEKYQMIQDMLLPITHLSKSLSHIHDSIRVYPLWLCPFKITNKPGFLRPTKEMLIDIGIYGRAHVDHFSAKSTTKKLEDFVLKHQGYQMLYADSYLTEEQFEQMFDHSLYDRMRKLYDCERAFPRIHHKVNRAARE